MALTLTSVRGADNGYIPSPLTRSDFRPIDYIPVLRHTAVMFRSSRKFIAVLLLLWLPVFTGSALAASVSMQTQQGKCHEAAMSHEAMDMGEHHMHHGDNMPSSPDEHSQSCSACGVCHLACTGYLAVPGPDMVAMQSAAREATPYLVVFHSFTSVPLLPPPLART